VELGNVVSGVVSTSVRHTFVQVLGRTGISLALFVVPALQASPAAAVVIAAWCIGDIFRHFFYIMNLLEFFFETPGWLTWGRYTISPAAYLAGVVAELVLYHAAMPTIDALPAAATFAAVMPPAAAPYLSLGVVTLAPYLLFVDGWGATGVLAFFARLRKNKLGAKTKKAKKA